MKRISCLTVLLFFILSSSAMAMGSVAKIPSPRAGLVILINQNTGLFANCALFEGRWNQRNLITIDQAGNSVFATSPIVDFKISSAHSNFHSIKVLQLKPEIVYTVLIIWTRVTGAVIEIDTVSIRTSSNPFRDSYTDPLGRKIWADKIIKLPRVRSTSLRKVKFKYEIDLNDLLRR